MQTGGDPDGTTAGRARPDTPAALFARLGLSPCAPRAADHTFVVVPSRGPRTFLVPVDSSKLAAAALTQHGGLRPPSIRAMRQVLGAAFRSGLAGPILRAGGRVVGVDRRPGNLLGEIEARLGTEDLTFAATAGAPGPFATPVLQLVDPTGGMVAFAKIGWDEITRRLVENEAAVLGLAEDFDFTALATPRLASAFEWRDLAVTLTQPLPTGLRRVKSGVAPAWPTVEEVARLGGAVEVGPVRESDMYARWQAATSPRKKSAALLAAQIGAADPHMSVEVLQGRWHGDFVAWNMASRGPGSPLHIWDWEYSATGVPVGLDLVHFHFQHAYVEKGSGATSSLLHASEKAEADLGHAGLDVRQREVIAVCHRLELLCREVRAESLGAEPDEELMAACAGRPADSP